MPGRGVVGGSGSIAGQPVGGGSAGGGGGGLVSGGVSQ